MNKAVPVGPRSFEIFGNELFAAYREVKDRMTTATKVDCKWLLFDFPRHSTNWYLV